MSLSHSAAMAGLLNSATSAVEDLEVMSAIMIMIGDYVPHEQVTGHWLSWFGRQLVITAEQLAEDLKEAR